MRYIVPLEFGNDPIKIDPDQKTDAHRHRHYAETEPCQVTGNEDGPLPEGQWPVVLWTDMGGTKNIKKRVIPANNPIWIKLSPILFLNIWSIPRLRTQVVLNELRLKFRIKFLAAIRTNWMGKFGKRMLGNICFHMFPAIFFSNLFAIGAYR